LLQKCFRSHPPPTGTDLVPDGADPKTAKTIRDLFAGRRWYELDPEFVVDHAETIWSMGVEAQRYYIPAFLLATFHAQQDWVYTNTLIVSLFLPLRNEDDPARDEFIRFLDALTAIEKSAIRTFLDFTANEHPSQGERGAAKLALRALWRKFEALQLQEDLKSA
jgi:hypothetical protein